MQEQKRRLEEERRKKEQEEQLKREEEERLRKEAEQRKRLQEQKRKREEEERRRKLEEEQRLQLEEERRRLNEEKRKLEEQRIKREKELRMKLEEERRRLEEEAKRKEEEQRRLLEEERRKLNEEKLRIAKAERLKKEEEQRRKLEEEKRRKAEEERKRKKLEEERQRKRKREEEERRRKLEAKRKEEERIKIQEEIKEKEIVENVNKEYQTIQVKNVPLKTFYSEYIQAKYEYENETFPKRKSNFIDIISNRTNTSSTINSNSIRRMNIFNSQNLIKQNRSTQNIHKKSFQKENIFCPGCGRMTSSQILSGIQKCTCIKEKNIICNNERNFHNYQNKTYENKKQRNLFIGNAKVQQNKMKERYAQNGQYFLDETSKKNEQVEYNLENEQKANQLMVQSYTQKGECLCPECKKYKECEISSEYKIFPKCKRIYI